MYVSKYSYTDVFFNGNTLVYGLFNRKEKNLTIYTKKANSKKEKKVKVFSSDYFDSYSGIGTYVIEYVYKNCAVITRQKEHSQKFERFKLSIEQ